MFRNNPLSCTLYRFDLIDEYVEFLNVVIVVNFTCHARPIVTVAIDTAQGGNLRAFKNKLIGRAKDSPVGSDSDDSDGGKGKDPKEAFGPQQDSTDWLPMLLSMMHTSFKQIANQNTQKHWSVFS